MNLQWTTRYIDVANATEEVISDNVRKAQWMVAAGWIALLIVAGVLQLNTTPDVANYLTQSLAITVSAIVLYLVLSGVRGFAHRRPHQWHIINWSIIWLFLLGVTGYFLATQGPGLDALVSFATFLCLYTYRWMMHRTVMHWRVGEKGISQHFQILGHTQINTTAWKEVRGHVVHPLTGAVELKLRGQSFLFRPRVLLIVPDQKRRKEIHAALSKILRHAKRS